MARFSSVSQTASRLIAKNGQPVTLRSFTDAAPADPDKPWLPAAPTHADQTVNAVFLSYAQKYIDGELIKVGDQKVLMAGLDLSSPPTRNSLVIRGSENWAVIQINPLAPNGEQILFELQVRQ